MKYRLTPLAQMLVLVVVLMGVLLVLNTCSKAEKTTGGTVANTEDVVSTLLITVQNESGGLIDGAEVYINGEYRGKTSKYGETEGTETAILDAEENEVLVKKEGYFPSAPTKVSSAQADQRLTVVLEKETSIVRVVVKDVYGRVLQGAVVSLGEQNTYKRDAEKKKKTQLTNDDGVAQFKKIADGWYDVHVLKDGYFGKESEVKVSFARQKETQTTLILEKLPQISMTILDEHNTPLEEAEVSLFTKKEYNLPGASPSHIKYTRTDGVVRFTDVIFDETYVLVVKKESFLAEMMEKKVIHPDEVLTVEMEREE